MFKFVETKNLDDLQIVQSWIKDAKAAHLWGGRGVKFPTGLNQLAADIGFFEYQNFVLKLDDEMAGFVQLKTITKFHSHISKVIICPQRRGFGYLKHLLEFIIEQAKHNGANFISLNVEHHNDVALKGYAKFGFEQYGFKPPDMIKMRLRM